MTTYFVVYLNVTDPDRFMQYFQFVMPVIECRGGRLVAQGTPKAIEGNLLFKQAVVFEWRSRQDFLDYWHSDEYAEIKQLREGAAEFQAVVIEIDLKASKMEERLMSMSAVQQVVASYFAQL